MKFQYFFGTTTNTIRSFNYNAGNGYNLANQNQVSCVRRERGTCRICWSAQNAIDVMLSGNAAIASGQVGKNVGFCFLQQRFLSKVSYSRELGIQ